MKTKISFIAFLMLLALFSSFQNWNTTPVFGDVIPENQVLPNENLGKADLGPVVGLKSENIHSGVRLNWDYLEGADYYLIYRKLPHQTLFTYCDTTTFNSYSSSVQSGVISYYKIVPVSYTSSGEHLLGEPSDYVFGNRDLGIAENLNAQSRRDYIELTWDRSKDVDGYIIYRKGPGEDKFSYLSMTSEIQYNDTTASMKGYSFYRVYPYVMSSNNTRIMGSSNAYVFGKTSYRPATSIKAIPGIDQVSLQWDEAVEADGYIIYRKTESEDKFSYRYMVTENVFVDRTASKNEYNFYRIYPYYNIDGKRILGPSTEYVYGRALYGAVKNLKATSNELDITVSWTPDSRFDGYVVYIKDSNNTNFRYLTLTNESFSTIKYGAYSNPYYSFFRVYPYVWVNGKRVLGASTEYVYGRPKILDDVPVPQPVITYKDYTDTVTVYFEGESIADDTMFVGERKVIVEGENGIREIVTRRTFTDGRTTSEEVISDRITLEPVTQVIRYGTKPVPLPDATISSEEITALFDKHNQARAMDGLDPLIISTELRSGAAIRAVEISYQNHFSHTRPNGQPFYTVSPDTRGENIAYGSSVGGAAFNMFWGSALHKANIMNPDYHTIGIASYFEESNGATYWVVLFGE